MLARAISAHRVQVTLASGAKRTLTADWIVDNAAESRDSTTNQKTTNAGFLFSSNLTVVNVNCTNKHLAVEWDDSSTSTIELNWLSNTLESTSHSNFDPLPSALCAGRKTIPRIEYDSVINTEQGVHQWTTALINTGICILENAPGLDHTVTRVARRIAPPLETLYGSIFDVRTEINPINIAYTNAGLKLHQDLSYYESPPGLQFLHCLEFDQSVVGGDSTFVDTFVMVDLLRQQNPEAFDILQTIPATFQKNHFNRDLPAQFYYRRPHITTNASNDVTQVFWSPAFEGPVHMDDETAVHLGYASEADAMDAYYYGYRSFAKLLTSERVLNEWGINFRASPGEILSFNQRRMLHGREEFHGEGQRHMQGCYVGEGDFLSRHRVLEVQHGSGVRGRESALRFGNGCHR